MFRVIALLLTTKSIFFLRATRNWSRSASWTNFHLNVEEASQPTRERIILWLVELILDCFLHN